MTPRGRRLFTGAPVLRRRPAGTAAAMSMTQPLEPGRPPQQDGIPAADAGTGAPPPAAGFGIAGEEPDTPERGADGTDAAPPADTPFRTPDPTGIGPVTGPPG